MREIDAENAEVYLKETKIVPNKAKVAVRELSGGVSNIVLRVDVEGHAPFVIKQCRERLRVAMEWRARLDRIWAERSALELIGSILPLGSVPSILFVDQPNYLFAMSCAPDDSVTWKTRLMSGDCDPIIAKELGTLLGTIHRDAQSHPILHGTLADTSLFDELRVDPYYRTTARAYPGLSARFDDLIDSMDRLPVQDRTLVLGDFSPKNILVHSGGLILLDFECAHRGDPTFDLGFFSSHLILKTIHTGRTNASRVPDYAALGRAFWNAYLASCGASSTEQRSLMARGITHTAACVLARVDGKSPVEYLDEEGRRIARGLALELFRTVPETWGQVEMMVSYVQGSDT